MAKALIIGYGVSGKSAHAFLTKHGVATTIADDKPQEGTVLPEQIMQHVAEYDFAVVSPGVKLSHPLCLKLKENNVDLICDIELGLRYHKPKQPLVGITGTNGKTTTTELVTHMLQANALPAVAVGNIGVAFLDQLDNSGLRIVELSSFQLSLMQTKAFSLGLIINISPNHLDHHTSMEEYRSAKLHLNDLLLDDGLLFTHEKIEHKKAKKYGFSPESYVHLLGDTIVMEGAVDGMLPESLQGSRSHDVENFLAAYTIARLLGVPAQVCSSCYSTFKKPPHRIEFVVEKNEISFFDDSKSTNVDATLKAVASMKGPVILIAGGVHKGEPYTAWRELFSAKVRALITIGQAASLIAHDLEGAVPVHYANSLEEALKMAWSRAQAMDNILLSPGCSSFDMFKNYKERGDQFQKLARSL